MSDESSSAGATVLAAAHATYVKSSRTPADWCDFVESVSHAMAPLQHAFPAGQPALTAGALAQLPRSNVSAGEVAQSAAGVLQRDSAATFEALVDELYASQGFRNSHHTGIAELVQSGSSMPGAGMSDARMF